jgi:hypothetical protein
LNTWTGLRRELPANSTTIEATRLTRLGGRRPDDGAEVAPAGIVVGIVCLPILLPSAPRSMTPADVELVVAIGMVAVWAASTRQELRLSFVVAVGVMTVAGTVSALFGILPGSGALAVMQDLYLLAWAMALANFGRSPCAGFTFGDHNAAGLYSVLSLLVIFAARRPRRWRWRAPAIALSLAPLVAIRSLALFAERHQLVEAAHSSRYTLVRNSLGREAQSSSERAELAKQTFLWRTSGLVGRGPVSTQQTLRDEQVPYPREAHNEWVVALVERGVARVHRLPATRGRDRRPRVRDLGSASARSTVRGGTSGPRLCRRSPCDSPRVQPHAQGPPRPDDVDAARPAAAFVLWGRSAGSEKESEGER